MACHAVIDTCNAHPTAGHLCNLRQFPGSSREPVSSVFTALWHNRGKIIYHLHLNYFTFQTETASCVLEKFTPVGCFYMQLWGSENLAMYLENGFILVVSASKVSLLRLSLNSLNARLFWFY